MKRIGIVLLLCSALHGSVETIKHEQQACHTWCGHTCFPEKIFYPQSLDEVKDIIANARAHKKIVRFFGSGHSINELVLTNDYLVNTDAFNKILHVDTKFSQVRVEGGIKLKHLYKQLAKHNLAVLNQGFIKEQSLAGALATGTHGTGKTGTMSDFIVRIELIDGQGNYHVISRDSHPEWFKAARLNLGALGFVYAITLQCVPLFTLEHERIMQPWSHVLEHLDEFYKNNDYCMFMAHPASDNVLVYRWNISEKEPTNNFFLRLTERLLSNEVMNYLTIKMAYLSPKLTNDFIDQFFNAMQQAKHYEYSYKSLSPIKNPYEVEDYREEEIAIPVQHLKNALHDIFALYKRYDHEDFELVGFMTIRFVKGSGKALLSPAYGHDCAYISLITLNCFKKCDEFYEEFERVMSHYSPARPHWGKYNTLTPKKVALLWGDNFATFNKVRKHFDPDNIFYNEYLQQRLG